MSLFGLEKIKKEVANLETINRGERYYESGKVFDVETVFVN